MNRRTNATCTAPIEGFRSDKIKLIALFTSAAALVILDIALQIVGM